MYQPLPVQPVVIVPLIDKNGVGLRQGNNRWDGSGAVNALI